MRFSNWILSRIYLIWMSTILRLPQLSSMFHKDRGSGTPTQLLFRGRGPAEPVEHAARHTGVGLVFSTRSAQMPLEGDWQLPGLARSLTLPMLRWPNNQLRRVSDASNVQRMQQDYVNCVTGTYIVPGSFQPCPSTNIIEGFKFGKLTHRYPHDNASTCGIDWTYRLV